MNDPDGTRAQGCDGGACFELDLNTSGEQRVGRVGYYHTAALSGS